jgi:hypothetical protein
MSGIGAADIARQGISVTVASCAEPRIEPWDLTLRIEAWTHTALNSEPETPREVTFSTGALLGTHRITTCRPCRPGQ